MISIVLPLKEENNNPLLSKNLTNLALFTDLQIIPVVGASTAKATLALLTDHNYQPLVSEQPTRAGRINDGVEASTFAMICVIHPRSFLGPEAIAWLVARRQDKIWGGFTHRFDQDHPLLNFTSWYSNEVRGKRRGIVYLDHCIFFHKEILAQRRPVPEVAIFEDTLLSEKFRSRQRPVVAEPLAVTSAIRFKKNGVVYQSVLNQLLKVAFLCGVSDRTMNRIYEKGLNLN